MVDSAFSPPSSSAGNAADVSLFLWMWNDSGGPDEDQDQARNPSKVGTSVESPWDTESDVQVPCANTSQMIRVEEEGTLPQMETLEDQQSAVWKAQ